MRKWFVVLFVLLLFIVASAAGCSKSQSGKPRIMAEQKASATTYSTGSSGTQSSSDAAGSSATSLGSDLNDIDDIDENLISSDLDSLDDDLDFKI